MTGATGLVGRAVVAALLARRYEVMVLARDPQRARETVPGATDYVTYQQEQGVGGGWTAQLAGVDHVVNLAGEPLFRPLTGRRYLRKATQQRITGTERLVAAMRATPRARTLINASSVGVYGFGPPCDQEVDEDTAPLPGRYAEGSAAWEAAATAAGPQARVVLLRMGYVLSADGGGLAWQLQQARKGKASYFAPGAQWLPWIHLDDVVEFVMCALAEQRWHGAYNLVAPQAVRSREFAHTLAHVVGSTPPRQSPAVFARVFVGAGADILLGGRRVVPARLSRAGHEVRHATLEDALRASATTH